MHPQYNARLKVSSGINYELSKEKLMTDGIFIGLIFGVAFSLTQKTFPILYRSAMFLLVGFVMAIVLMLIYGWVLAVVFYPAQWVAYAISARVIKPQAPWHTEFGFRFEQIEIGGLDKIEVSDLAKAEVGDREDDDASNDYAGNWRAKKFGFGNDR
jgi:hypothetical protein